MTAMGGWGDWALHFLLPPIHTTLSFLSLSAGGNQIRTVAFPPPSSFPQLAGS